MYPARPNTLCSAAPEATTRREFLTRSAAGLGSVALASLMADDGLLPRANAAVAGSNRLLAPRPTHFTPRAKSVIFLFMTGGPSQLETFDPKPVLNELAGQPLPDSFGRVVTQQTTSDSLLLSCKRQFIKSGQ